MKNVIKGLDLNETNLIVFGHLKLEVFYKSGRLKEVREASNKVTNKGVYMIMDQLLASPSVAKAGWMEVGTGTIAGGSQATATILNAYLAGSRQAFTTATSRSLGVVTYTNLWAAGVATGAITEAGIFNVVTQNTTDLCFYQTFSAITVGASDTLQATWTVTLTAS
jgi:hypothetical protein